MGAAAAGCGNWGSLSLARVGPRPQPSDVTTAQHSAPNGSNSPELAASARYPITVMAEMGLGRPAAHDDAGGERGEWESGWVGSKWQVDRHRKRLYGLKPHAAAVSAKLSGWVPTSGGDD